MFYAFIFLSHYILRCFAYKKEDDDKGRFDTKCVGQHRFRAVVKPVKMFTLCRQRKHGFQLQKQHLAFGGKEMEAWELSKKMRWWWRRWRRDLKTTCVSSYLSGFASTVDDDVISAFDGCEINSEDSSRLPRRPSESGRLVVRRRRHRAVWTDGEGRARACQPVAIPEAKAVRSAAAAAVGSLPTVINRAAESTGSTARLRLSRLLPPAEIQHSKLSRRRRHPPPDRLDQSLKSFRRSFRQPAHWQQSRAMFLGSIFEASVGRKTDKIDAWWPEHVSPAGNSGCWGGARVLFVVTRL